MVPSASIVQRSDHPAFGVISSRGHGTVRFGPGLLHRSRVTAGHRAGQPLPGSALHEQRNVVAHRPGDAGRSDLDGGFDHRGVEVGKPGLEALLHLGHLTRFVCWVHQHRIGVGPGGHKQRGGSHPQEVTEGDCRSRPPPATSHTDVPPQWRTQGVTGAAVWHAGCGAMGR